jgi:hypothetical protein
MKSLIIAAALVGVTATASAFAQTDPSANQAGAASPLAGANTTSSMAQPGQPAPPAQQPIVGKTRAQVYQEMVQAQQDGETERLNETVFKGE